MISACILIRAERGKFDQVAERLRQIPEVKTSFSVLGRYDIVVDVEAPNSKALAHAVLKASRLGGVVFTETLPQVESE
ncbi:MAG: Lrp/AsnC ligand binding domain-containing protein [Thaumarchaeota archaeon]|nr:Lrp/AsnC ligand binding domain-containing protein [Nitrososphaerota archaeon]